MQILLCSLQYIMSDAFCVLDTVDKKYENLGFDLSTHLSMSGCFS